MVITEAQYQHLEQTQWNNAHSHDPSGIPMPLPTIQKMAREKFPAQFQHRYLEQNIVKESMYLCIHLSIFSFQKWNILLLPDLSKFCPQILDEYKVCTLVQGNEVKELTRYNLSPRLFFKSFCLTIAYHVKPHDGLQIALEHSICPWNLAPSPQVSYQLSRWLAICQQINFKNTFLVVQNVSELFRKHL